MNHWSAQYVGIPAKLLHSSRDGCDCYGLLRLVYREVFDIQLPEHRAHIAKALRGGEIPAEGEIQKITEPTDDPQDGDVLHMWAVKNGRRMANHVGIVVQNPHKILHLQEGSDSCIMDIRRPKNAWRPIQYYRRPNR
jgi:cell wall-associated NlpC family hydrolase